MCHVESATENPLFRRQSGVVPFGIDKQEQKNEILVQTKFNKTCL